MDSPLISVIVPVYNKEQYVAKLINCIQEQTFRLFECVIIDDGSTDKSGAICDEMASERERFSVVHIQNGGASHARNTALGLVKGEYITFLDADDEIPTDYLQKIADDIGRFKTDMVIGAIRKVSESGEDVVRHPFEERVYTMPELLPDFAEAQRTCGVFGWCVNKTFKRELVGTDRFDETLKLCEDFDFFLKLYSKIQTVYFDCENYYLYLSDRGGLSATNESQVDYVSQTKIQIRCKRFLEKQGVWSEKNADVVSERIRDFLFFSVFHSPEECFDARFEEAHQLYLLSEVPAAGKTVFRKKVIKCIAENKKKRCKTLVFLHRRVSGLKRRRRN